MTYFSLSQAAEFDLERLYEYGIEHFGVSVATEYFDGLVAKFDLIAESPLQYPSAEHILPGYRLCVYREHSVYFRVTEDQCEIMRILNGQDIESALQNASLL